MYGTKDSRSSGVRLCDVYFSQANGIDAEVVFWMVASLQTMLHRRSVTVRTWSYVPSPWPSVCCKSSWPVELVSSPEVCAKIWPAAGAVASDGPRRQIGGKTRRPSMCGRHVSRDRCAGMPSRGPHPFDVVTNRICAVESSCGRCGSVVTTGMCGGGPVLEA